MHDDNVTMCKRHLQDDGGSSDLFRSILVHLLEAGVEFLVADLLVQGIECLALMFKGTTRKNRLAGFVIFALSNSFVVALLHLQCHQSWTTKRQGSDRRAKRVLAIIVILIWVSAYSSRSIDIQLTYPHLALLEVSNSQQLVKLLKCAVMNGVLRSPRHAAQSIEKGRRSTRKAPRFGGYDIVVWQPLRNVRNNLID